jgi:hypothetical protein
VTDVDVLEAHVAFAARVQSQGDILGSRHGRHHVILIAGLAATWVARRSCRVDPAIA